MNIQRSGDKDDALTQRQTAQAVATAGAHTVPELNEGPKAFHEIRYISIEAALASYEATLPQHERTYRELAKHDTMKITI